MPTPPEVEASLPRTSLPGRERWPGPLLAAVALFSGSGARQGYLAAIDQGLISLANFLATVMLARAVTPTELGVYGVGFTSLRLVRSIQEGIAIQPANAFGAALDAPSFRRYASSCGLIQLLFALLSAAAVALGGWILTRLGNDTAGPTLFSLWFAILSWQLQEYVRRLLYARGRVASALANTLLANALRLGLMAAWALRGGLSGAAGLHAIAWGSLGALVVGLFQARSFWTLQVSGLAETWKRNWGFGRWVLGGMLANWVAVEFYPVLTAGMISFAAAGAYRAIQNLVAPIHLLLRALDTFLTPRAARLYQERGQEALARTVRLAYLTAGLPILGVLLAAILFPGPLLRLLYGETYLPYRQGVVLMAIFYALMYAYWPLQVALKAARRSQPIFAANLAASAAMFTIGIWMILRWNVFGTIGGQALNALIVSAVLWQAWRALRRENRPEAG